MPNEAQEFRALADRFFQALEAGDVAVVAGCYAEDARVWHNYNQVEASPSENLAALEGYFFDFPVRKYVGVRRHYLPQMGVMQQHVVHLVRHDGRTFDWPGCIILEIHRNRISRVEEYVDMASFMQKMA